MMRGTQNLLRAATQHQSLPSGSAWRLASTSRLTAPLLQFSLPRTFSSAGPRLQDQTTGQSSAPSSSQSPLSASEKSSPQATSSSTSGPSPSIDRQEWKEFGDVFTADVAAASNLLSSSSPSAVNARSLSREEELEAEWANRPLLGTPPAKPHTGRTVQIDQAGRNVAVGYKILMATLNRNAVRRELKLTERYEKPNQMRVRKKSERHRRRFAEMIREKVKLVLEIKNRGG